MRFIVTLIEHRIYYNESKEDKRNLKILLTIYKKIHVVMINIIICKFKRITNSQYIL